MVLTRCAVVVSKVSKICCAAFSPLLKDSSVQRYPQSP